VWEERYQNGDTPWDRGCATPAVEEAMEFFAPASRILVPGCGLGHDALAFAQAGHEVEGWDLSSTAIERANDLHDHPQLRFREMDFFENEEAEGSFDGIFEHTFLCAIGPENWERAIAKFAKLLRPRGQLFAILFTHLKEQDPPPWQIQSHVALELFGKYFEVETISTPKNFFADRKGEETVWRMKRL